MTLPALVTEHRAPAEDGASIYAMEKGGELIGTIGWRYTHPHGGPRSDAPRIGYWLARSHWGQGLMTEALRAVCAHLFDTLGIERIESGAFEGNTASLRVMEKVGFKVCGGSILFSRVQNRELPRIETLLTRDAFRGAKR